MTNEKFDKIRTASYLLPDPGGEAARKLLDIIEFYHKALEPFALMHREGSDPNEVACIRGVASDMTMITSGDFAEAARIVGDTKNLDF